MLFLVLIITIILANHFANHVSFTSSLDRYLPDEENIEFISKFQQQQIDSINNIMLCIRGGDNMLSHAKLASLSDVVSALQKLHNVNRAISITNIKTLVQAPGFGPIPTPYLDLSDSTNNQMERMLNDPEIMGNLIAKNQKGVCVFLSLNKSMKIESVASFRNSVDDILLNHGFSDYFLLGRIIGQETILGKLKSEMRFFLIISFLLVTLILALLYRSFWSIAQPLVLLLVTIIWTMGLMALFNKPVDVLISIVPGILFVIGTSDVVHIYERYRTELRQGFDKETAIYNTYKTTGKATVITSITTIIGFLTLLFSAIVPIKEFGLIVALGVAIALLLTCTLFPAMLLLLPPPQFKNDAAMLRSAILSRLFDWIFRNKAPILIVTTVACLLSIFGISKLKTDNFLTEELPDNNAYKQGYAYLEAEFSGARPLEIVVFPKHEAAQSLVSFQVVREMDKLEKKIHQLYKIEHINSINLVVRQVCAASDLHFNGHKCLQDSIAFEQNKAYIWRILKSNALNGYRIDSINIIKIMAQTPDVGGAKSMANGKALFAFARDSCQYINLQIVGIAHLLDVNNQRIANDMIKGLALAFVLISLLMSMLYKSWKIALITMIPNVLPLLVVAGFMAALNIDIKISTALIFTIAFGIVVDDTIHFLIRMKHELEKGHDKITAIKNTYLNAGSSIVLTTVILCFGFVSLSFSDFASTQYLGTLVSLTLVVAVLADLILLPILLNWLNIEPDKKLANKLPHKTVSK